MCSGGSIGWYRTRLPALLTVTAADWRWADFPQLVQGEGDLGGELAWAAAGEERSSETQLTWALADLGERSKHSATAIVGYVVHDNEAAQPVDVRDRVFLVETRSLVSRRDDENVDTLPQRGSHQIRMGVVVAVKDGQVPPSYSKEVELVAANHVLLNVGTPGKVVRRERKLVQEYGLVVWEHDGDLIEAAVRNRARTERCDDDLPVRSRLFTNLVQAQYGSRMFGQNRERRCLGNGCYDGSETRGSRRGCLSIGSCGIIRHAARIFRGDGGVEPGLQEEPDLVQQMRESGDFVLPQLDDMPPRQRTVRHEHQTREGVSPHHAIRRGSPKDGE